MISYNGILLIHDTSPLFRVKSFGGDLGRQNDALWTNEDTLLVILFDFVQVIIIHTSHQRKPLSVL